MIMTTVYRTPVRLVRFEKCPCRTCKAGTSNHDKLLVRRKVDGQQFMISWWELRGSTDEEQQAICDLAGVVRRRRLRVERVRLRVDRVRLIERVERKRLTR